MEIKKINLKELYQTYLKKTLFTVESDQEQKVTGSLYIIFSLITLSFFGVFAINPTLTTISNLKKQYQDNTLVKNALAQKLTNLKKLSLEYQQISPQLESVYAALPATNQIPYFIGQLDKIARENSLSIDRLDTGKVELYPADKKADNQSYSFSFQIAVEGANSNVNNFIKEIINFERVISIDNLGLEQNNNSSFKLQLGGKAYFSKK